MQFLNCPPSAVLLLCDVSVEIIIPEEDKEYDHVDNHCLEIYLISSRRLYPKNGGKYLCDHFWIVAVEIESLDRVEKHKHKLCHLHPRKISANCPKENIVSPTMKLTFSTRDISAGLVHRLTGDSRGT